MALKSQHPPKEIFLNWLEHAQEFSHGKKTFLEFAEATMQTSSLLTPYPPGPRHPVWIPLEDILETARAINPQNVESSLLSLNSTTQGNARFVTAGIALLNYGFKEGAITERAASQITQAISTRFQKIMAAPAP